jgi:trimeric autotransporter adhesin
MNPLTQSKNATILPLLIALTFGCFGLSPHARAVCQEGCLTNQNTVLGEDALISNTSGTFNTAIGLDALFRNTIGNFNTATGFDVLIENTTGSYNTAIGVNALHSNTTGQSNTATGNQVLFSNTTGENNTAIGAAVLLFNTTGQENTGLGASALLRNTGSNNIALGFEAGRHLTRGSFNIDIGNRGLAGETKTIRIGTQGMQTATYIAGISEATVPTGVAVIIDADGHLGTSTSSARFKEAIRPMDKASEAILALKPVTFRYKHELDPDGIPQFGLVAEEVEKVNPDLVARDADGKAYTVRYEAVNAMLLNEFIKEHQKVQRLEAALAAVNERLKAQDAKIDRVNAKVELTKPAPQMVVNDQ